MKTPSKKQLDKFKPIYDYYLRNGDNPNASHFKVLSSQGIKIEFSKDAPGAMAAAWMLETYGKNIELKTSEPEILAKFYDGKGWHGINIENWSDSLIEGTLLLGEFAYYDIPECFYDETCGVIKKKLQSRNKYCPSCFSFSRDDMKALWNKNPKPKIKTKIYEFLKLLFRSIFYSNLKNKS